MTDKNSDLNHEDHQNIEKILQERPRFLAQVFEKQRREVTHFVVRTRFELG